MIELPQDAEQQKWIGNIFRHAIHCGGQALGDLLECLQFLEHYGTDNKKDRMVQLYSDFAPFSMTFTVNRPHNKEFGLWERMFNGGIIYEGPNCPADGSFPSLSVSIDPSDRPTWRIHT